MPERMMIDKDGNVAPLPMTKREQIAAMCLQGLLGQAWTGHFDDKERVKCAVEYADALLQALEAKP